MKVIASRRRRLNVKLLLVLALSSLMVYFVVTWWHTRQIRTAALQLRERGMSAREAGNHRLAVEELGRYVGFAPEDTTALADYTDSLSQCSDTQRVREQVFALNEEILRRRPDEMGIREFQARLALDLKRIPDAASHVESIEKKQPLSAGLWYVRGRCAEESHRIEEAIKAYREALATDPNHVEATEHLAGLLSKRKADPAAANKLLTDLVQRTGSVDALLLRARRSAQSGDETAALADLKQAVELAPENAPATLAFAAAIHRQIASGTEDQVRPDDLRQQCISLLRGQIERDPENTAMRMYLVKLFWLEDETQRDSIQVLRAGCELEPGDEELLFALVDATIAIGDIDEATSLLPRFGNELDSIQKRQLLRARINMAKEDWDTARAGLSNLIASVPRDKDLERRARMYEATCLRELNQNQQAVSIYERTLERSPDAMSARLGLAQSYLHMDKTTQAINEYRRLQGVPHIAAFLSDLMIEFQYNQPLALRRWEEVEKLVRDGGNVTDPIERTALQADVLFAKGETKAGWELLTQALADEPESKELSLVVDQVSALLLDKVLASVDADTYDVSTQNAATMVVEHWSGRDDAGRLKNYFEKYIGGAVERDAVLARMSSALFLCTSVAKQIAPRNRAVSTELLNYANDVARQLVQLEPAAIGQRLQLLAESGQVDRALSELNAVENTEHVGLGAVALMPFCYGNTGRLNRMQQLLNRRGGNGVESQNAQAMCLSARGQHDRAIKAWERLHTANPKARNVALNLAWLLAVYKTDGAAAEKVLSTVDSDDGDVNYLSTRACVEITNGDLTAAQKTLGDLVVQNTHLTHLVHLAYVRAVQERFGEAKVLLRRVRESGVPLERLHPLDKVLLDQLTKTLPN